MSVAHPPPNSEMKIAVSGDQVFLYLSFTNEVTKEKRNYALVITEEWNRFIEKVAEQEAAAMMQHMADRILKDGLLNTAEAEICTMIEGEHFKDAEETLDALLQDIHQGGDDSAVEGLRVHSALWQRLQEAKKAAASRN